MTHLMIYGATGYTGRMAAAHAKTMGLPILIAGRDEEPLRALAEELGVKHRVFALDDGADIDAGLTDVAVLLNCAGPFLHTAEPLMRGALRNGVHYLDIAAELELPAGRDAGGRGTGGWRDALARQCRNARLAGRVCVQSRGRAAKDQHSESPRVCRRPST